MKLGIKILKWLFYILLIPILYLIISLGLSLITIDRKTESQISDKTIYLSTNGVHLDIIIPKKDIDSFLLDGLKHTAYDNFISFGWGDENFYINTPNWSDLTFANAFRALFLDSSTLMHVTRYQFIHPEWTEIKITESELDKLNSYLQNSFKTTESGMKIILDNQGYSSMDDFYNAKGSYSCFKTCNSWVNTGFKESGLKACLWTPFDFVLIKKYQ